MKICKNFLLVSFQKMTPRERGVIQCLSKCDFEEIHEYYKQQADDRKNASQADKLALRKFNRDLTEDYGYCILDGRRQRIGNFRVEPPGLFCGRGNHPNQGRLKERIEPEDVTINCSLSVPRRLIEQHFSVTCHKGRS